MFVAGQSATPAVKIYSLRKAAVWLSVASLKVGNVPSSETFIAESRQALDETCRISVVTLRAINLLGRLIRCSFSLLVGE